MPELKPILWLTRWPPYSPLRGGDIDYSRELLENLATLTPVHALAFDVGFTPPNSNGRLRWTLVRGQERSMVSSVVSPHPNVAHRHHSADYLAAAVKAADGCSAIVVDFIGMFGFAEPLKKLLSRPSAPPIIVIDHNYEHAVRRQMAKAEMRPWLKVALAWDAFKAGRLETSVLQLSDGVVALTDADSMALKPISGGKPTITIPPGYEGPVLRERNISEVTPRRLVVLGGHEAQHKKMVLERALEALNERGIQHRLIVDIVGPGSHADLERRFDGFNFMGYVDDLPAYMSSVRLGFIPDEIGGGFKLRALSHAFLRTPMLAVDQALNGMGFTSGRDYFGFDNLAAAAAGVEPIIDDFARLNTVQEAAFALCNEQYNWAERGRDLLNLIEEVVQARDGKRQA